MPIALLVVDAVFVLGAVNSNNALAQSAARYGANKSTQDDAEAAVKQTIGSWSTPAAADGAKLQSFEFDELRKLVTVQTEMEVKLPVPLPGVSATSISASSTQPIVGIPASR